MTTCGERFRVKRFLKRREDATLRPSTTSSEANVNTATSAGSIGLCRFPPWDGTSLYLLNQRKPGYGVPIEEWNA